MTRTKSALIENFNEIKAIGTAYQKPCPYVEINQAKNVLDAKGLFKIIKIGITEALNTSPSGNDSTFQIYKSNTSAKFK
jgi:hypothetical protein